jgi:hypothetical protein
MLEGSLPDRRCVTSVEALDMLLSEQNRTGVRRQLIPLLTYTLPLAILDVPFIAVMDVRQLLAKLLVKRE